MEEDQNVKECKVVLVGESGVGKTSIISRFINDKVEKDVISTTGASFAGKIITFDDNQGKNIYYKIWDTAGQERYRSMSSIFFKDAKAAILVYDITEARTFEELKNYWFSQVKENSPEGIIIAIAANKCDLYQEEQVSEEMVRKYAQEMGAFFRITSAYDAVGIDQLFYDIGKKFFDPNYTVNCIEGDDGNPIVMKKMNVEDYENMITNNGGIQLNSKKRSFKDKIKCGCKS